MKEFTSVLEVQNRGIEIRKSETFDIILNTQAPDGFEVDHLAELFADGIPQSWPIYDPSENGDLYNLFVDSLDSPKYICKIRKNTSPRGVKDGLSNGYEVSTGRSKKTTNALNTIIQEFRMAPILKSAFESSLITSMAKRYGYDGISVQEPLLGVIDKIFAEKMMIYKFIDGVTFWDEEYYEKEMRLTDFEIEFLAELRANLSKLGIEAWDLWDAQQFVETNDENGLRLHLIDVEGYTLK